MDMVRPANEIHRGTCATVRWCGWRLLAGLSLHLFSDNLYPRTLALAVTLLHEILSCTLTCEFTVLYGVFYSVYQTQLARKQLRAATSIHTCVRVACRGCVSGDLSICSP